MHQWHVISLLIHSFLLVNSRLLIAFGTAFYAIVNNIISDFNHVRTVAAIADVCLKYFFCLIDHAEVNL